MQAVRYGDVEVAPGLDRDDVLGAANHDPAMFDDPDALRARPARTPAATSPSPPASTTASAPRWPSSRRPSPSRRSSAGSPTVAARRRAALARPPDDPRRRPPPARLVTVTPVSSPGAGARACCRPSRRRWRAARRARHGSDGRPPVLVAASTRPPSVADVPQQVARGRRAAPRSSSCSEERWPPNVVGTSESASTAAAGRGRIPTARATPATTCAPALIVTSRCGRQPGQPRDGVEDRRGDGHRARRVAERVDAAVDEHAGEERTGERFGDGHRGLYPWGRTTSRRAATGPRGRRTRGATQRTSRTRGPAGPVGLDRRPQPRPRLLDRRPDGRRDRDLAVEALGLGRPRRARPRAAGRRGPAGGSRGSRASCASRPVRAPGGRRARPGRRGGGAGGADRRRCSSTWVESERSGLWIVSADCLCTAWGRPAALWGSRRPARRPAGWSHVGAGRRDRPRRGGKRRRRWLPLRLPSHALVAPVTSRTASGHEERRDPTRQPTAAYRRALDRVAEPGHRRLPQQRRQRAGGPQRRSEVDAEQQRPHPVRVRARAPAATTTVAGRLFIRLAPSTARAEHGRLAADARRSRTAGRGAAPGAAATASVPSESASTAGPTGTERHGSRRVDRDEPDAGRSPRRPRPARRAARRR